jgi:hypothetical protein
VQAEGVAWAVVQAGGVAWTVVQAEGFVWTGVQAERGRLALGRGPMVPSPRDPHTTSWCGQNGDLVDCASTALKYWFPVQSTALSN